MYFGSKQCTIAEQLKVHASEELAHALEVARQIDYLGGDPTVTVKDAEYSQDSKRMLEIDLKQEQETDNLIASSDISQPFVSTNGFIFQ